MGSLDKAKTDPGLDCKEHEEFWSGQNKTVAFIADVNEGSFGRYYANRDPILGGFYVAGKGRQYLLFKDADSQLVMSSEPKRAYDYEARMYKLTGCMFSITVEKGTVLGVSGALVATSERRLRARHF